MGSPTIVGEASTTVHATPAEVVAFVLDLRRYKEADHKIGRIGAVRRTGDRGTVTFTGRLRGLPGPGGTYPFRITGDRLVVGTPTSGPARWFIAEFEASFTCEPTGDGTRVTHREVIGFRRPWRWLAHPLLRRWLPADTAQEMQRFQVLVDHEDAQLAADAS